MRKILFCLFSVLLGVNFANAQHPNVLISDVFNPNEPSICIDPNNPAHIVAGANLNNVYYSPDTGRTWVRQQLTSPFGVWGDPAIAIDEKGDFLFLHLSNPPNPASWIDRIICQKSGDAGKTWSEGTYMGLNEPKDQDKQWIAINPATNHYYVTWTEFDKYGSTDPQDSSRILFSKSIDAGLSWSPPRRINRINGDCVDSDNTVEGAVPCVGPNGEIYVVWAGPEGLVFDKSMDDGATWLDKDIKIGDFPGGWDYDVPGAYRCNGLPVSACDRSGGKYQGTIYVNWSDQRKGQNDTDVWLVKSIDGGQTWSAPIRVNNDPPGSQQFFTWMSIDQRSGWLWFVFYDRRNYNDNRTDVYMAVSRDGGSTFQNFKVSESPFVPSNNQFLGDYTNLSVNGNIVRPIWTRMDGPATSVWTALIDADLLEATSSKPEIDIDVQQNFPNPASTETWIPFKIRRRTAVTLEIANPEGQVLQTIFKNKVFDYGKYAERIPLQELGLPDGNYWILVSSENKVLSKRLIVIKTP